jgi:hypothetical protein
MFPIVYGASRVLSIWAVLPAGLAVIFAGLYLSDRVRADTAWSTSAIAPNRGNYPILRSTASASRSMSDRSL